MRRFQMKSPFPPSYAGVLLLDPFTLQQYILKHHSIHPRVGYPRGEQSGVSSCVVNKEEGGRHQTTKDG